MTAIEERLQIVEADWRELQRQNAQLVEVYRMLERRAERMEKALQAVLLFHGGDEWNDAVRNRWVELVGKDREATTKGLCDCVRAALGLQP